MAVDAQDIDAVGAGVRPGLLAQLWRRRILFASVFVGTLAAVVAAMMLLPPRYLASGSVIVAEQEAATSNASAAWVQKLGDPADLESQLLLIRSPRILRLALARPGVLEAVQQECQHAAGQTGIRKLLGGGGGACAKLVPDSDALVDYAAPHYTVGSVGRSRVIAIAYQSPIPEVSQTMANALINAYLDDQRAMTAQSRESTAAWLWQEVSQLDGQLRKEEGEIQAFRRANGLVRGANAPISSERLTSISQQLSAAQAAQAEAAARLQESGRGTARGVGDARAVLDSRVVADIKQQLAVVSAQLASAAQTLGPNHPTLIALTRQQAELQRRVGTEASSIASGAQRAYDAAAVQVASLTKQLEALKGDVGSATDGESSIASMVRSTEIKRGLYVDLYKRASDLETERRVLVGSTRLVSLAELPTAPSFPKRTPFAAAGLTVAMLLATAAAMLRDLSDRSVRAAAGLEAASGVPVFGQLPQVQLRRTGLSRLPRVRRDAELDVALHAAQRSPVAQDALRGLHARLVIAGIGGRQRNVLVTSAVPREGKTFTTIALAQLIAAGGRRVLVLECDLRCPRLATALKLKAGPGVGDVLRGFAEPQAAVVQTKVKSLDIIPAGPPCADSTELLMGSRFAELLMWAEGYDLVLIDSPPSDVLMDARVMAQHVDGVLCCSRWGETLLTDTASAVAGLREAGGNVLGMVVTMVQADEHGLYDARPVRTRPYMVAG